MIGLGIVTYNRPEYFKQCIDAVLEHLIDVIDYIVVYNDGSDGKHTEAYNEILSSLPGNVEYCNSSNNQGVAIAKNWCLRKMMEAGCNYLFLAEDDIIPLDRGAIVQYIALSRLTGNHHLLFAHHGDGNTTGPLVDDGSYQIYTNCVGAWNYYSRTAIETVGYMDEHFNNAWEHVEHTHRISQAGLTTPFGHYMDVPDSTRFLREIPESIDNSSIRQDAKWKQKMLDGLYYWRDKDHVSFPLNHTIEDLKKGRW